MTVSTRDRFARPSLIPVDARGTGLAAMRNMLREQMNDAPTGRRVSSYKCNIARRIPRV